jgi:V/A-type H+/Na+-transporting ATPase subunit C
MSPLPWSGPDFVFGNTRLRARRAHDLGAAELVRSAGIDAGTDLDGGPGDRERRRAGLGAASEHLRGTLRGISTAYEGAAGEVVGVLLARYDLADVLTLLRGALGKQPADLVLPAVFAVHRVTSAAARDVASAGEPGVAVQRLLEWRLPDPATAKLLIPAWERYELHRDVPELEREVAFGAHRHWLDVLARYGAAGEPVRRAIERERADRDLVAAARAPGADAGSAPDPTPGADRGGATRLEDELAIARAGAGLRGWSAGDPLGADVPVAAVLGAGERATRLRRTLLTAEVGGGTDG